MLCKLSPVSTSDNFYEVSGRGQGNHDRRGANATSDEFLISDSDEMKFNKLGSIMGKWKIWEACSKEMLVF